MLQKRLSRLWEASLLVNEDIDAVRPPAQGVACPLTGTGRGGINVFDDVGQF